jgi:hypothetical protein
VFEGGLQVHIEMTSCRHTEVGMGWD